MGARPQAGPPRGAPSTRRVKRRWGSRSEALGPAGPQPGAGGTGQPGSGSLQLSHLLQGCRKDTVVPNCQAATGDVFLNCCVVLNCQTATGDVFLNSAASVLVS